uniref:Isoform Tat108 of Protein Tat n=1 Tax=Bovine immunodeficiency virus (strain R29) TaxID=417296 RepID=P19564-2
MPGPWVAMIMLPQPKESFGGKPIGWLFWNTCKGPRRDCPHCCCPICSWHCQLCFLQKNLGINYGSGPRRRGTRGKGRRIRRTASGGDQRREADSQRSFPGNKTTQKGD